MAGSFISSLLDGVDIFLGFSLILFVAVVIANFGEQIRLRPKSWSDRASSEPRPTGYKNNREYVALPPARHHA